VGLGDIAIKCCPDPVLLKVMSLLGAGFDVASQAEIQLALGLGTAVDDIIFANPCKPKSTRARPGEEFVCASESLCMRVSVRVCI
jgi:diaminopimelate decarboxylase